MAIATNLGFPRIGAGRELKSALEDHWAGQIDQTQLQTTAATLRSSHWQLQHNAGIEQIPCNDFSLYDHVLDTCAMVGAVPQRFGWTGGPVSLETYFHMARGRAGEGGDEGAAAMEMTKWFDTNYHYIVPEFEPDQRFCLASTKPIDAFGEARAMGIQARPVLLGPVSLLLLGRSMDRGLHPLELLPRLLPVYDELLRRLHREGAEWVQLDEPGLVLDLDDAAVKAYRRAFHALAEPAHHPRILLASYFGGLRDNLPLVAELPVAGLHVDLVREPGQLAAVLEAWPRDRVICAGVVDGRNIWRNDLAATLDLLERIVARRGRHRLWISPSCSLLHVPIDLEQEQQLDESLRPWLAFARQKLEEVAVLTRGINSGRAAIEGELIAAAQARDARCQYTAVHDEQVRQRVAAVTSRDSRRASPFARRRPLQHEALNQPLLPTTTIGSFPQTAQVRRHRAQYQRGEIDRAAYERFLQEEIGRTIRAQEQIGLDVLVHGEPERNDMVQYFGEKLSGLAFTQYAWVQSYGSRCVRPPIIYGDVERPEPMTVDWAGYAQSLTDKPVKGMLTGPVTVLQWSFVRNDQPREKTCKQIALAIRDEVSDLEAAGIKAIQIDEPAIREGLPLRHADRDAYNKWAVEAFRLASACVKDETQIHTHMCYSEFNEMMDVIADMDADVISIEASRSQMELLNVFAENGYPNEVGPGVYDIHSPRVPTAEEMAENLRRALAYLQPGQVWVNPDCGLKTRKWDEVEPALRNMVKAAQTVRGEIAAASRMHQ